MHIAHSLFNTGNPNTSLDCAGQESEIEISLRYRAYQTVCDKYNQEIKAIQKYIPGWWPEFR